jgi:opacity protein-like surface antigen
MKPLLYEIVEDPSFQSKTITSFSYTVGLGIQRVINPHWSIGVGYELADFGRSVLGPTPVQTGTQGLILNHLYTNQLQFSLHYLN